MHLTTSFRKLNPPQNRQLIVYYYQLRVEGADVAAVAAEGAMTDAESVSRAQIKSNQIEGSLNPNPDPWNPHSDLQL